MRVHSAEKETYDHLTEVENALKGLGGQLNKLNGVINSGDLAGDALKSAENLRSALQNRKTQSQVLSKMHENKPINNNF